MPLVYEPWQHRDRNVTIDIVPAVVTMTTENANTNAGLFFSRERKPNKITSGSRSVEVGLAGVGSTSFFLVVLDTACQRLSTIEAPGAQNLRSIIMSVLA